MARRAVWRERPEDRRKSSLAWLVLGEGAQTLPLPLAFLLLFLTVEVAVDWSAWVLLVLPWIALNVRGAFRRSSDLASLITNPAPGPTFLCQAGVYAETDALAPGAFLGADSGVLTFVEGWLHFSGERTDFSFRPIDVERGVFDLPAKRLALREAGTVTFALLPDAIGPSHGDPNVDFTLAFRAWSQSRLFPAGEPILPPATVHATGLARARRGVANAIGLIFASPAFAWLTFHLPNGFNHAGFFAFLFIWPLAGPFVRLKALNERVRQQQRALSNEKRRAIGP